MIGVDQPDRYLVRTGREIGNIDCIVVARVRPPPRQVIDNDVQMPDAGGCVDGARPEHRHDAQVLRPVLGSVDAQGDAFRKRRVHDQLGGRLFSTATYGEGPRISRAVWAKALVASTVAAAAAARVLMSLVIVVSPLVKEAIHLMGRL
jgi:hypothetical protein